MLTTQQQVYNQQVQKDYVEHIQFTKEVEQMATKQKSSKKSQPAVSDETTSSKKSDGFKEQKDEFSKKILENAKEVCGSVDKKKIRIAISGAYHLITAEIKSA